MAKNVSPRHTVLAVMSSPLRSRPKRVWVVPLPYYGCRRLLRSTVLQALNANNADVVTDEYSHVTSRHVSPVTRAERDSSPAQTSGKVAGGERATDKGGASPSTGSVGLDVVLYCIPLFSCGCFLVLSAAVMCAKYPPGLCPGNVSVITQSQISISYAYVRHQNFDIIYHPAGCSTSCLSR
jgi:hypothetical protein